MDAGDGEVQCSLFFGLEPEIRKVVVGGVDPVPQLLFPGDRFHQQRHTLIAKQSLVPFERLPSSLVAGRVARDTVGNLPKAERLRRVQQHQQQVGDPFESVEAFHRRQSRAAGTGPRGEWRGRPVRLAAAPRELAHPHRRGGCGDRRAPRDRHLRSRSGDAVAPPTDRGLRRRRGRRRRSPHLAAGRPGRGLLPHRAHRPAVAAHLGRAAVHPARHALRRVAMAHPTSARRHRAWPGSAVPGWPSWSSP